MSSEMNDRIKRAISRTWDAIGYDLMQAVADSEGIPIERVSIPQDEAVEMSCDCYLEIHGGDKEAAKAAHELGLDELYALGRQALPFKSYGL